MPINKDPRKRRRGPESDDAQNQTPSKDPGHVQDPYSETELDREKALADAESKNLWDATEVIDMDNW